MYGSHFATWRTRCDAFIDSDEDDFGIIRAHRLCTIPHEEGLSFLDYRFCDWIDEENFRTIPDEDFGTAPEEEGSMFHFYGSLVKNIVSSHRLDNSLIGRELGEMIDCYKRTSQGRNPKILDFDQLTLCVGYLHRYAYCHSVLVRRALVKLLDVASPNPLREKLDLKRLRAVFLGSGPGNDLVGFLSALYGHHGTIGEINATCVDRHIGWGWVLHESIRNLRQSSFGNCTRLLDDVNVAVEYVSADLTNVSPWWWDVREHLRKADIVFLVKFLSHVPDEKKLSTLQNVAQSMQPGALLVYIDCPFNCSLFEDTSLNLRFVYGQDQKVYIVKNSRHQFGFSSIERSTAFVKLYEKKEAPANLI